MSNIFRNRWLPIGIVFIFAATNLFEYYTPILSPLTRDINNWSIILSAYAMMYGFLRLIIHHGRRVIQSGGRSLYSIWLITVMMIILIFGLIGSIQQPVVQWIYSIPYQALKANFQSLAFLYMCSAALRVFRFKDTNSYVYVGVAVIVMLSNMPVWNLYTNIFVDMKEWILTVPSAGAMVGFNMGIALGSILVGIRMMLGLERGWLGEIGRERG